MIRRGDVYYADLSPVVGSEQGGVRPVVVVQNDKGNRYSKTIIVAPISKKMSKPPIPTHVIFSDDSLSYVSMILCEQLRTIDKKRLGQWICTLDEKTLEKINRAIRVSLVYEYMRVPFWNLFFIIAEEVMTMIGIGKSDKKSINFHFLLVKNEVSWYYIQALW